MNCTNCDKKFIGNQVPVTNNPRFSNPNQNSNQASNISYSHYKDNTYDKNKFKK